MHVTNQELHRNFATMPALQTDSDSNRTVLAVIRPQTALWITLLALLAYSANAQRASGLSADFPDRRTFAVQNKVDDLFDAAKFDRAFFIYRNELVPLGDKYAQYMVGYMLLTGLGVGEDHSAAYAWYRLAAERDTPEFVAVRNRLRRSLIDDEIQRANAIYAELRRKYCDLAVLLGSIKKNQRELQPRTGSRLKNSSSPMTVIETRGTGVTSTGYGYYGRINRRLLARVQLLLETGQFPELGSDPEQIDLDDLERLVKEKVAAYPD